MRLGTGTAVALPVIGILSGIEGEERRRMSHTVFITGATGGVGAHLITQLVSRPSETKLVLLVRAESEAIALDRIDRVIQTLNPEVDLAEVHERLTVLVGDVTDPELGLSRAMTDWLRSHVTHIVHAAATTKFHVPIEIARLINVTGTQNVLRLARRICETGKLQHLAHISTAYVCGTRCGEILEDEPVADRHSCTNSYDASKCEAEGFVREARREIPISIFRPSIVVGDSHTGRTTAFNGLYAPLRLIQRGLTTALPALPGTPLDVVSTDYISSVLQYLLLECPVQPGGTYHVVAGPSRCATVAEIVADAVRCFNTHCTDHQIPAIEFVPPDIWEGRVAVHGAIGVYAPYTCLAHSFDDRNTREVLQGSGIAPRHVTRYLNRILEFCLETGWGRSLRRAA
jgi:thioester reductase-like protein